MPRLVTAPEIVEAAGNIPKRIEEFIGRVNTNTPGVSIARMTSTQGWVEPGQTPEFDEYTVVLRGTLRATSKDGKVTDVTAGQAIVAPKGEWIRYSTPHDGGAEYISVCIPGFSPDLVHRDDG